MNLSDYRQRLTDVYGNTTTSDDTFYNRVINDAYRKLCALSDWWWLETYEVLTFDAPVISGYDFLNVLGSADYIMPSAASDRCSTAYKFGWAYTGSHTYRISSVQSAGNYYVVLDADLVGDDSTATAWSMTFWNDAVTLSTAVDHVLSLHARMDPNRKPLQHVGLGEIEQYGPDVTPHYNDVGRMFATYRETAIDPDQTRLRVFPPPSETMQYVLRYIQTPSDMANDTATAMVPTKHEGVLADMARLELLKVTGADLNEIQFWEGEVAKGMARMASDQHKKGNVQRKFGSRGVVQDKLLPYRLTNYTVGDPI